MKKSNRVRIEFDLCLLLKEPVDSAPYVSPDEILDALFPLFVKAPWAKEILPGATVTIRLDFRKDAK